MVIWDAGRYDGEEAGVDLLTKLTVLVTGHHKMLWIIIICASLQSGASPGLQQGRQN